MEDLIAGDGSSTATPTTATPALCTTPPSSPSSASRGTRLRTPPAARRTPPKKSKRGRRRKQRRCIAGGYDYLNWCTNCVYGSKHNGNFKKPCDGPRRIPPFGCDYMDTDRTGLVDNDGTWASPTAPGLLVGRFVVDSGKWGYVRSYEDPHFTVCFAPDDTTEVTKEKLLQLLDAVDNTAEQPCDELLGRFVQKTFNDGAHHGRGATRTFLGMIKGRHEDGTYYVVYEDGDCEDLGKHEVEGILRPAHLRTPRWTEPTATAADCGRDLTTLRSGGAGRSKYAYSVDPELRAQRDAAVAARQAAEKKLAALRGRVRRVRRELAATLEDHDGVPGPLRRMERASATGQGFSATRTRRMHAAKWESRIAAAYPTDVKKQISVAGDLARRYCVAAVSDSTTVIAGVEYSQSDIEVCVAIAESLKAFCAKLRSASGGRMHNDLRLPYRLAAMAASLPGGDDSVRLCSDGLH